VNASNGSVAAAVAVGQGVFVTGELISYGERDEWKAPSGDVIPASWECRLLVNDSIVKIRFRDESDLLAAVGEAVRGDSVTLPVFVSGAYDPESRSRGAVSFRFRY
jgi:hypothetical protein